MIRRQFKEQYCHFRPFCSQDYESIVAEKNSNPRAVKPAKVSLKVGGKICSRAISPSPIFHHRYTFSQNCPTVAQSTKTLKPTVRFSWKNEMVQTTKKVFQNTEKMGLEQIQMRQTKIAKLHEQLMIESKYTGQKLSFIGTNQHIPQAKFEESVILVDYFNPSSQQMSRIQNYLDVKGE